MKRRDFIKNVVVGTAGLAIASPLLAAGNRKSAGKETHSRKSGIKASAGNWPVAVCTWNLKNAVAKAGEVLKSGGNSLDAVEQGTMVEEADETNMSVGKGGRPDRDGHVTLDACIMNKNGDYGAVAYLQNIVHPISVARKVMEKTPHAILAGAGALQFAKEQGFTEENLLTEASEKAWKEWLQKSEYKPVINIE
ncbi:MAG: isoaspartyl peptidase/L-asparaginase, partial [Bacteroidetes bacterium]|nr:isoaspartyl peptidase/L-asparaginase [Bacteroidota bacterium]